MPATSPTLSPTLSAMVAGLRGSSSGMPASTLPTRSAPTSAAFVKIPPPTRANRAWRGGAHAEGQHRRGNHHQAGGKLHVLIKTSQNPVPGADVQHGEAHHGQAENGAGTEGNLEAGVQGMAAGVRPRPEAYVAVFMPIYPARPEKKPPEINAKGTQGF